MDRTIFLRIAYDGTDYHGWQEQSEMRTVQSVLAQAMRRTVRHQVSLHGSGRTDSGVHAAGQVAHFKTSSKLEVGKLRHAIGSRLPKDVTVLDLHEVAPAFHSRSSAQSKLYRYRIYAVPSRPVEHKMQRTTYHYWRALDVKRMAEAAVHFLGKQDFSAMAASGCVRKSMVRRVIRCEVYRVRQEIRIDVEGEGFLYKQVRNMVGTLIQVGEGKWEPQRVALILQSRDRANAGNTAPARGLTLQWVRYPPHLLRAPTPDEAPKITPLGEPS